MTKLRPFALGLFAVAALATAGCGSDDDKSSDSATTSGTASATRGYSAAALKDVQPRSSKANIVGGDAPIADLVQKAAGDAASYFGQVFSNSNLTYAKPTITVATQATQACNKDFDPTAKAFSLCASESASTITFGAPKLDEVRTNNGDAGAVFLSGFVVAADANDQLTGRQIAKGGSPDAGFYATSACFTGAWIKNLADRKVLEAGDDEEVLRLAAEFVNQDPAVGQQAVKQGFNGGIGSCQSGSSDDGSNTQTDTSAEPAPSPTG